MATGLFVDVEKIPVKWVRSYLTGSQLDVVADIFACLFSTKPEEKRWIIGIAVEYLQGSVKLEQLFEMIGSALSLEKQEDRLLAAYVLFEYYIEGITDDFPVSFQFHEDYDSVLEDIEEKKDYHERLDKCLNALKKTTKETKKETSVDNFAPDSLAMVSEIIDPAHELMPPAPMVIADTKLGIRSAELGIAEAVSGRDVAPRYVRPNVSDNDSIASDSETPAHIVEEAIRDLHEAANHQIYAVQVAAPDYAALAKEAVNGARFDKLNATALEKITALAERRLRALGEAYDFRARATAWAEANGIDARGLASLVAAVEMAFMKLHAADGAGTQNSAPARTSYVPTVPVETYDLEKSITEKMSAGVVSEKKEEPAAPAVKKEVTVPQADPSRAFVDALAQSKPVTVLPDANATGPSRAAGDGAPMPDKGHEIPYVARIPTWQDKLKRDVKPVARALLTPIDEIRTMTVAQWRRLGATPEKCAERLREKALAIASEAADKRVEAVKAWRQTEMYRQYVAVGAELMRGGTDVPKAIAALKSSLPKGEEYITPEEWKAILDLNSSLRFS